VREILRHKKLPVFGEFPRNTHIAAISLGTCLGYCEQRSLTNGRSEVPNLNRSLSKHILSACALSRRELLAVFGTAAAAATFGWRGGVADVARSNGETSSAVAAAIPACVVRPEQTEGPYFIDERLNRSDIRVDPSDQSVKAGMPLRLAFQISRIGNSSCKPLSGAVVDIWHCDALGVYSDVRDINAGFDTRGKKFVRGYQVTNSNGIVEFLTVYPGWYEGRAVHIHFKIRTDPASRSAHEFVSQLYFDETVTDKVHRHPPYNAKRYRTTSNDADFIFRRGGKQLMLALRNEAQGYSGKFDIGLQMA
jgi:protocatechuate 3,4-dioxygenase beta subunit